MSELLGGCYCGAIRYRVDAEPFHATICHCADCRRVAGAPTVAWFSVPIAGFGFTGKPVRFASSVGVERTHCGVCGTCLTYRSEADEIDVTIANLDDPDAVRPRDHTLVEHRIGWDVACDKLPVRQVSERR